MPDMSDRAYLMLTDEKQIDDPRHFCRLFADMITEGLCGLRRRELNIEGVLSCHGCGKDPTGDSCAGPVGAPSNSST